MSFVLEHLLQPVVGVATNVANRGAMIFGDVVNLLGELSAAFFGEWGNGNAHEFAVVRRIQTEIGGANCFLNWRQSAFDPTAAR